MPSDQPATAAPCPKCGHSDEDHQRQSWYDEEGFEGMECQRCLEAHHSRCSWWTWDWSEVVAQTATHEGGDDV